MYNSERNTRRKQSKGVKNNLTLDSESSQGRGALTLHSLSSTLEDSLHREPPLREPAFTRRARMRRRGQRIARTTAGDISRDKNSRHASEDTQDKIANGVKTRV